MDERLKVLLIEDNPGDARLIVETLREIAGRPFELEHVSDLASGLERLADGTFALVLLDLGLPDSQGRDTLLNVLAVTAELAIVILTGLDDEEMATEMLQLGAQDYLPKGDIEARQLSRTLRYAIERKQVELALREANLNEEIERQRERERIAMDLHDGVIQDIYAVSLSLEALLGDLPQSQGAHDRTGKAIDQLHDVVRNIRSYIFDLRPRQFGENLCEGLADLAREFRQDSQIRTDAVIIPELPALSVDRAMALYHIAHEALSNARKHAHPQKVAIELSCDETSVILQIRDDGAGFDIGVDLPERHRGLRNMYSRARNVGAEFVVQSALGEGTLIRVELPLQATSITPLFPRRRADEYAA